MLLCKKEKGNKLPFWRGGCQDDKRKKCLTVSRSGFEEKLVKELHSCETFLWKPKRKGKIRKYQKFSQQLSKTLNYES